MQTSLGFRSLGIARHRLLLWIAVSLALVALVMTHVYVEAQEATYTGFLLALDHAFDLAAVVALTALCLGVGLLVVRLWQLDFETPLESLIFGVALGCGVVGTFMLILGLMGLLHPSFLGLLLVGLAALARHELRRIPSLLGAAGRYVRSQGGSSWLLGLAFLSTAVVAFFCVTMAAAPPMDWDGLMYHLHVPVQFLDANRVYLPEDNLHTAFVGLVHFLYLVPLQVGSAAGPALFSALTALLLGLAAFSFSARFFNGETASMNLWLIWGTTTILLVAITPRVDVTLIYFLFLAHYALIAALTSDNPRGYLGLSALLLGFGFGVKYHALFYLAALVPLAVWVIHSRAPTLIQSIRGLALFALVIFGAALPWLVKNWILFKAPIHPFLTPKSLEPWLAALYGTSIVPDSIDPQVFQTLAQARMPFNILDAFFAPGRITIEYEGAYHFLSPILLLLPLCVLFFKNRTLLWLIIPAVTYYILLLVPFPFLNLRYLIPGSVPASIAVVYVVVRLANRFFSPGAKNLLLALIAGLVLIPSAKTIYVWLTGNPSLAYLVGRVSERDYPHYHIDPSVRALAPFIQFTNENLDADSRILMLFESRGFYFEHPVLLDTRVTNWPLLAPVLEANDCLRSSAGITHILFSSGAVSYYVRRGLDLDIIEWEAFREFSQRCLDLVHRGPAFVLLETRSTPRDASAPATVDN